MAIVSIPGLWIPEPYSRNVLPSAAAVLLDAAGEKAAFIVRAPKTGNIRKIHFRTGSVTTATNTDLRLETVDLATGDPSGSLFGVNTNVTIASASITGAAWIAGTLTADAVVTEGDLLAIVVAPTGTPNYNVASQFSSQVNLFPYTAHFTAAWAKSAANYPVVALEYDDGSFAYMPGVYPLKTSNNSHAIASDTTPDEVALKFRFPVSVRVSGVWLWIDLDGDTDVVLYDADGTTVLASRSLDANVRASAAAATPFQVPFPQTTLLANTYYRLALKPATTTVATCYSFDVNSAAILDQMPGGQDFHFSQRTDAGAWTDTTTRRPWIGLGLDGIERAAPGLVGAGLVR